MNSNALLNEPTAFVTHASLRSQPRLRLGRWLCGLLTSTSLFAIQAAEEAGHHHQRGQPASQKPSTSASATNSTTVPAKFELPPLPSGVSELKFSDFFVLPVGTRGLKVTDKLRRLDGQRVRILGYMVHQEEPPAGRFLFTPMPAQIHEHDNGLADDLPASTLYVSVPALRTEEVPYVSGLMLLTGTLNVGNRAEPDGRISVARLALDPSEASPLPSPPSPAPSGRTFSTPAESGLKRLNTAHSRAENAAP